MELLIFCTVLAIILVVVLGLEKKVGMTGYPTTAWRVRPRQLFALCAYSLLLFGCFTEVKANSVGIVYSAFSGTSEVTLGEGFHLKTIFDKVYQINTELQTLNIADLTTQTKDSQYVTTALDVKYKVNSNNAYIVFKQFRTLDNVSNSLIGPAAQRELEKITTKYNVMDILGESRTEIYDELDKVLSEELAKYGIDYDSISIVDMAAHPDIEAAITAEAVARNSVETAKQNLIKAEIDAQQLAVAAKAEQEAAKIKAETKVLEAEAEKKANELLALSYTEEILLHEWIVRWNGQVPIYYTGEGTDLIFNAGSFDSNP